MIEKYCPSDKCLGCKYAMREYRSRQTHSDLCRKRFLELSEMPGNEAFEHNKPTFSATKRSFIPFLLRNGLNPLAGSANLTK